MFQINEAFDKNKNPMERFGKAIGSYSENNFLDKVFYFDVALFTFMSGNNDMNLKNFTLIESSFGWALAPAYDILNVSIVLPRIKWLRLRTSLTNITISGSTSLT